MSTFPKESLDAKQSSYKRTLRDALDEVNTVCNQFPYNKFHDAPYQEKRKCIEFIARARDELRLMEVNFETKFLAADSDDATTVQMNFTKHLPAPYPKEHIPLSFPSAAGLKVALEAVERVLIEFPAPVPVETFQEQIFLPSCSLTVASFVRFETADDAERVIKMGKLTYNGGDELYNIEFSAASPTSVRKAWLDIRNSIRRLDEVQCLLGNYNATETNNPYPFKVEITDVMVVDATPEFLESLRDAQERFERGDHSRVHLLSKVPVKNLQRVRELVEELNKERISLINLLRQYQGRGYVFDFDLEI